MTALQLYKFLQDNGIEYHWHELVEGINVICFIPVICLSDFIALHSSSVFDDDGIMCHLKQGYLAIWMKDICEHYGIELNEVFKPEY